MGLETGTYISDLNTANPLGTDAKSQGDDHIRLIKTTIKNTFPFATMGSGLMKAGGSAQAVAIASASDIVGYIGTTAVTNATNAGKSTNVAGGSAGGILYQTAVDTTGFASVGTGLQLSGGILSCTVTAPVTSVVGQTGAVSTSQVMTALQTVDGTGSGLDADLLDGNHASAFSLAWTQSALTTLSGTSVDFTGIPSGVKEIVLLISGAYQTYSSFGIQLGGSGGIETTGYEGGMIGAYPPAMPAVYLQTYTTCAFISSYAGLAARGLVATVRMSLIDSSNRTWLIDYTGACADGYEATTGSFRKSTSSVLDRVRLLPLSGGTFGGGKAQLWYR